MELHSCALSQKKVLVVSHIGYHITNKTMQQSHKKLLQRSLSSSIDH